EDKCSAYCFNLVRPILEHTVNIQVKDQQIHEQATVLKKLENEIAEYKLKVAVYEETIRNRDLLSDKCKIEIAENRNIIAAKDELISKAIKSLTECTTTHMKSEATSCIGRATDIYDIKVPGMDAFSVPCDSSLVSPGWTVIQRRMDGSVDFNRNWTEYREGFGDLRGEFFIGLEKMHLITKSQIYELYIYLKDEDDKHRYARYDNFSIGNEDESYKLNLGNYSGNAGDALKIHRDQKFSTPDGGGCAQTFKSGWWYESCYMCNLNGIYNENARKVNEPGVKWNSWTPNSLKFVQMMIRPKND
ncbi:hypothetical protein KR093_001260, partial [Drosophila rubida]